jgi:stearoyl-CoA desaturase (Delta-9 desaturase)
MTTSAPPNPHRLDSSACTIWALEKLSWASDVRWPRPERLDGRRRQCASHSTKAHVRT